MAKKIKIFAAYKSLADEWWFVFLTQFIDRICISKTHENMYSNERMSLTVISLLSIVDRELLQLNGEGYFGEIEDKTCVLCWSTDSFDFPFLSTLK